MGFCSCSPMLVLSQVNGAGDCRSWQQRQQKWRKSISRLDWEKGWELRLGERIISMVTTVMLFFGGFFCVCVWGGFCCFFSPVPTPHLYPSHLLLLFLPLLMSKSPCCYTISHLFKVFNRSQSFSMLHLIKRSSVFIKCVRIVLRVWEHAYPCTHYSLQCQIGKRNEPRARHNEMLIICFGGSCYCLFFLLLFELVCLTPH